MRPDRIPSAPAAAGLSAGAASLGTWVVFPALLVAVVGAAVSMLSRNLPPPLISTSILLGIVTVMLVLERLAPLHRAWNRFPDGWDLLLVVLNRFVDVAVVGATVALLASLESQGNRPQLLQVWPTGWPLLAQAVLGIAIAESIRYALHRLSHRPGLLGRIHRTHHQPRRMYTLNGPRLHPLNQLWIAIANVVPMLIMGAALPAVILAMIITSFFVLFQHANVRLRFEGWNRLLATPDVHRVHHLREQQAGTGANFGIVIMLFDRLFGTFVKPSGEPHADAIGPIRVVSP
jgi:sterol desaturase/sphingolipid hydroxylase (fatty acid hydroxylase superfamily)